MTHVFNEQKLILDISENKLTNRYKILVKKENLRYNKKVYWETGFKRENTFYGMVFENKK